MRNKRRLRLSNVVEITPWVAAFAGVLARQAGLTRSQAYRLRLAAEEITTNIAEHGYHGGNGVIDLEGMVEDDLVCVRIEDDAPPFDPLHHAPPPPAATGGQAGGYGLRLALTSVYEYRYEYVGGRNRNILVIHRSASSDAAPEHAAQ